ncbi:MAG TPA: 6-pyruvoyl-tetrahydropterin synthase-related protein [Aridibacter sp.]|nr:6-pyruvoyl-tetrahydropterin synthase-related protein [Aridibacter sp.]
MKIGDRTRGLFETLASGQGPYLSIAVLSIVLTVPFLAIGFHTGADLPQHVQFADTYSTSIASGDLLPGWGADENLGYGSLGVRFYPPLTGFLTGLAHVVTGNWLVSFAAVILMFTFAGGIGVFLLAGEFMGRKEALAAGLFFVVSPHHVSEIFTTFFYAQYAGAAILSFALLFTARVCRNKRLSDAAMLAAAYGLLILTHLPLAIIASLSLPVFALFLLERDHFRGTLARLAAAAAAGLAAASFYWIKLVYEIGLLRHTKFWKDEIFHFRHSFLLVPPGDVVFGLWYNNLILLTLAAFAGCAVYAVRKAGTEHARKRLKTPIALFLFAAFMTTPLSYPLWAFVPYLKEIQFPWRWLAVVNVAASLITGAGLLAFAGVIRSRVSWRNPAVWGAVAALVLAGAFLNKVVSRYSKEHIPANSFHAWAEQRSGAMGFEYFWTAGANPDAFSVSKRVTASGRGVKLEKWEPEERVFRVSEGAPTNARIATLFYPHWKAEIDGRPALLEESTEGVILLPLPAGDARIRIRFEEPLYIRAAEWTSAIVWFLLIVTAAASFLWPSGRDRPSALSTGP